MVELPSSPRILATGFAFIARFRTEIVQQKGLVAGAFAALLSQTLIRLLEPWPLGIVIDHVLLAPTETAELTGVWARFSHAQLLAGAALAVFSIAVVRALTGYAGTVGFAIVGNRVLTSAREKLFRHLQSLSLSFHNRSRSGDVVIRVIGDVGTLRDVTVTALLPLFANFLVLLGMISVMAWLNWQLTLLALSTVPLFWLSMLRLGRRIQIVSRKQRRQEGELASTAAESLVGIETVQALSLDETFAETFGQQNEGSMREGVKAKRLATRLERTVDVLAAVSTGLVLYFGARAAIAGGLRPGELVVFLAYLKTSIRPLRGMAKYTARIAKASAAAERVLEILNEEPEIRDRNHARDAPEFRGDIAFEHASFSYGRGSAVLTDVDLRIPSGAHVSVIGESGAGKSTLLASVLRLMDPIDGSVRIDGYDIREFTIASLRRQIAVVPQETLLFSGSVAENIAFGRPGATLAEIEESARAACAHEFIMALPRGYAEPIGERGADLSAGQRRRLSIARAHLSAAPIVILDEPLASLDAENQHQVARALDAAIAGRTTLHATHDLDQAARSDRVIVIEAGGIQEFGSPSELLQSSGIYAHWVDRQKHNAAFASAAGE